MLDGEWRFYKYKPGQTVRDSASIKAMGVKDILTSVIREFVQNSLDAVEDKSKPVRIVLSAKTLPYQTFKPIISGLIPHLKAKENEKAINIPKVGEKVLFLILEDFNTVGLEEEKWKDFYQKDNITSKNENSTTGGSHGVGKIVFYDASEIKTFLGYSVFQKADGSLKEDSKAVCTLNSHKLEGEHYFPDGNLDLIADESNQQLIAKLFRRKPNQKGLSIAIPYVSDTEGVREAFSAQYYYPIVKRKLEADFHFEGKGEAETLDGDSLVNETEDNDKIGLLVEYLTRGKDPYPYQEKIQVDHLHGKKEFLLDNQKKILEDLESNKPVFITFSVEIEREKRSDKEAELGELVFLLQNKKQKATKGAKADFWRDNLLITEGGKGNLEYHAIVLIESDGNHLGQLLRLLENAGHNKWQKRSTNNTKKEGYKSPSKLVNFIENLPQKIINLMQDQDRKRDPNLVSSNFPTSGVRNTSQVGMKSSGTTGEKPEIPTTASNPDFTCRTNRAENGFTVRLKNKQKLLETVEIEVAYASNAGNPFSKYDKRDFDFNKNIKIIVKKGKRLSLEANKVKYTVNDSDFSVSLSGFDPKRELKIRYQLKR